MTVTTPPIALNPFYTLEDGRNATLKNIETWVWIDLANVVGAPVTIPLAVLTAKPQLVDPNGD